MANALLTGQPTGSFLGVNLRQDRLSLADQELAKAINADLHSQPGTIILRLGRTKQNSSALTDTTIRRLARINSNRYRVAGQSVYCGTTRIFNGVLSSNLITTIEPVRPLNDSTIWAFIADDSVMKKANCTTVGVWGIPAPTAPDTKVGVGGSLTGDYTVRITYVRFSGTSVAAEGNGSTATDTLSVSSNEVAIGDIDQPTDTTTNGIGVYRTVAGGSSHILDARVQLVTTEATGQYTVTHTWEVSAVDGTVDLHFYHAFRDTDNSRMNTQQWEPSGTGDSEDSTNGRHVTFLWEISDSDVSTASDQTKRWAYSSNTADTSLSGALETDNNVPPEASYVTFFQGHAILVRDADNKHYMWFSKRFKPEAVPSDNFLEIGNPDDPLQCAISVAGLLGVFARRTKYRILGNVTTGFVAQEAVSKRGTPAPMAALGTQDGIVFVARDGIFATNLVSPDTEMSQKIAPLFFGETVNDMSPFNWTVSTKYSAAYYKGRYYLSYADGENTTPNKVAVFSRDTANWYFYEHTLLSLFTEEDTDLLLGGSNDGFVYVLELGDDDAGTDIAMDVETKDFEGAETKNIRKLFQKMKIDANTLGETVTVKFYVDDTLKSTQTFSTSGRQEKLLSLPQGTMGYHWRMKFTYTGDKRVKIYPCAALYLPMVAA